MIWNRIIITHIPYTESDMGQFLQNGLSRPPHPPGGAIIVNFPQWSRWKKNFRKTRKFKDIILIYRHWNLRLFPDAISENRITNICKSAQQ